MDERIAKHLYDALQAARSVAGFVDGVDFAKYSENLLLRSGVERQFEILGEALRRIRESDEAIKEGIAGARPFRSATSWLMDTIRSTIESSGASSKLTFQR